MATDPRDNQIPPTGDAGTHPLEPTRPEVPEYAQPKSVESHPGAIPETEDHVVAHEASDVNIHAIATFVIVLFVVGAIISAALVGLMSLYAQRSTEADPAVTPLASPAGALPPEPRLLTDEPGALRQVHSEEDSLLKNIDAAKQSVVGTLPARAGTSAPAQSPARAMSRMDTSSGRRQ